MPLAGKLEEVAVAQGFSDLLTIGRGGNWIVLAGDDQGWRAAGNWLFLGGGHALYLPELADGVLLLLILLAEDLRDLRGNALLRGVIFCWVRKGQSSLHSSE